MATPQDTSTTKNNTKIFTIPQLPSCWERCNVKSTWDSHLNTGSHWLFHQQSSDSASRSEWYRLLLYGFLFMGKASRTRIMIKLWSNLMPGLSLNLREQWQNYLSKQPTKRGKAQKTLRVSEELQSSWGWQSSGVSQRTPQIRWWHLKIMTFANQEESWNSKTVIYGWDQQIYHGTFLSSWLFVRNRSRTIFQEHPKNGWSSSRKPRSRRSRKTMMDEVMPTGKHHLGHGISLWLGHLHLGNNGVRTKRVSILIGKHHLIGAAQIQRVTDPFGDHQVPGSHHSHDREEWVPHLQRHFKGIHDDENNVCLWRATIFS